jgi:hypothetical protein
MKKLLLLITLLITLISCDNNRPLEIVEETNHFGYWPVTIDTLTIHGYKHEFIRDMDIKRGGICHSPECWCYQEQCLD